VKYAQKLSARAVKDLDALDDKTKQRMLNRIAELAAAPYDPKLSIKLTNQGGLRRSRVAGWGSSSWSMTKPRSCRLSPSNAGARFTSASSMIFPSAAATHPHTA
jgi:hypothetical protein